MKSGFSKRALDLGCAIVGWVALSPVLVGVSLLVAVSIGVPIFFRQVRPEKGGKPFNIYKFKTMTDDRDAKGNLLPDADRLTALGRFLRSTSLDELTELFNVIIGEMSPVGSRPLLV